MPVDYTLPLQIEPFKAPDSQGAYANALRLKALQGGVRAQEFDLQQRQAAAQELGSFRGVLKDADFSTIEGRKALQAEVLRRSPTLGMGFLKEMSQIDLHNAQVEAALEKVDKEKATERAQVLSDASEPSLFTYFDTLQKTGSEEKANAAAQPIYIESLKKLRESGKFSDQELQSSSPMFNASRVLGSWGGSKVLKDIIDRQEKVAKTATEQRKAGLEEGKLKLESAEAEERFAKARLERERAEHPERFVKPVTKKGATATREDKLTSLDIIDTRDDLKDEDLDVKKALAAKAASRARARLASDGEGNFDELVDEELDKMQETKEFIPRQSGRKLFGIEFGATPGKFASRSSTSTAASTTPKQQYKPGDAAVDDDGKPIVYMGNGEWRYKKK